jgi:ABC-type uncharacterized transport system permease subunit
LAVASNVIAAQSATPASPQIKISRFLSPVLSPALYHEKNLKAAIPMMVVAAIVLVAKTVYVMYRTLT